MPKLLNLTIWNQHNHDLTSVHTQSFKRILPDTVSKINRLFENKLLPIAVKKEIESTTDLSNIMDRSINPSKSDIYRLNYKYIESRYGAENGPSMFHKLEEFVSNFKNGRIFYNRKFSL